MGKHDAKTVDIESDFTVILKCHIHQADSQEVFRRKIFRAIFPRDFHLQLSNESHTNTHIHLCFWSKIRD